MKRLIRLDLIKAAGRALVLAVVKSLDLGLPGLIETYVVNQVAHQSVQVDVQRIEHHFDWHVVLALFAWPALR